MSQQSEQIEILKYAVELGREAERHKYHATQLALVNVCNQQNLPVPTPLFLSVANPYLGQQPVLNAPASAEPTKRADIDVLDQLIQADRSQVHHSVPVQAAAAAGGAIQAVAAETVAETSQATRLFWRKSRKYRIGFAIGVGLILAWKLGWVSYIATTITTRLKTLVPPPTPPAAIESPTPESPTPSPSPLLPESPTPESSPAATPPPEAAPPNPDQPSTEQILEDILKNQPAAS